MNRTTRPTFPQPVSAGLGALPGVITPSLLAEAYAATSKVSLITDAAQKILHVSDAFTAITGYDEDDVLGLNCRLLQGPGSDPSVTDEIRRCLAAGDSFEGDILNYRKDGSPFWNGLSIIPLRNAAGATTHFVSVQRDINTRIALQEQLRIQAGRDPVTGLPNRSLLESHLLTGPIRVASLGMIDLDDFRQVRSTLGYDARDDLLRQLARRLTALLHEGDYLASLGTDEFVLVLEELDEAGRVLPLRPRLARLHEAVETPFDVGGQSVTIGMSLGLARFDSAGHDIGDVLRRADAALQRARSDGAPLGDWFSPRDEELQSNPLTPQTAPQLAEGRGAAERDLTYRDRLFTGGLSMFMQPIIDLRTGEVSHVEALARLILIDGTMVAPDTFLPRLSGSDLDALFRMGLDEALRCLVQWGDSGLVVNVSVNLSPTTLMHPDCSHWVEAALRSHGLKPQRLTLELLETSELDSKAPLAALDELANLGVGLALDDLGSGYSSLKRMAQLTFNTIKVDRSLLAFAVKKPVETLSLIAALAQMGRDFGTTVVVEGLEDAGLAEAASVLGATHGQGYFFARPMPADALRDWARKFELPERFHLPERAGRLQTEFGALSYHWQFTRWSSPHPFGLMECPISGFIAKRAAPGSDPDRWHKHQHDLVSTHAGDSRMLLDWLVAQVGA